MGAILRPEFNNQIGPSFGSGYVINRAASINRGMIAWYLLNEGLGDIIHDPVMPSRGLVIDAPMWEYGADGCWMLDNNAAGARYVVVYTDHTPWLCITGALTIVARMSTSVASGSANRGIVAKWLGSGDKRSYALIVEYATNNTPRITLYISSLGTSASSVMCRGATALSADVEYVAAGVYVPGVSMTVYLNSAQDAQVTASVPASIYDGGAASDLWLGMQYAVSHDNVLLGKVGNVQIWNRALSAEEIRYVHRFPYGTAAEPRFLFPRAKRRLMVGTGSTSTGNFWPVILRMLNQ